MVILIILKSYRKLLPVLFKIENISIKRHNLRPLNLKIKER